MDIKLTFVEPEDRPIREALFHSSEIQTPMKFKVYEDAVDFLVNEVNRGFIGGTLNKQDFADFTALVNRINKQLGN